MKQVMSYSGAGWRSYALRMARYGAQLRAAGLAHDHPERRRVREGIQLAIREIQREQRHIDAGRRLIVATGKSKALGTGRGRRIQ